MTYHRSPGLLFLLTLSLMPSMPHSATAASIERRPFGKVGEQEVELFTFKGSDGSSVSITNYGGIIQSINVPDRTGKLADVALGYNNLEGYLAKTPYFGCITGRYANRICKGKFTLDGKEYSLALNNETNALHGGKVGFDKKVWKPEVKGSTLNLYYTSPAGEEGYPGKLDVHVAYTFAKHALSIAYEATTDAPTVVNLTNHCYFNLAGEGSGKTILDHKIQILADRFTPVDATLIPTGIASLEGTPLDFRKLTAIGERIGQDHPQLKFGLGYDHNYIVQDQRSEKPKLVALVQEPTTGRTMEVLTTEPGVQFYCGNFLDGSITGKSGKPYAHRMGLCLEAQIFPDSPNNQNKGPGYTNAVLRPGEKYRQVTVYRFGTEKQ